MINSLSAYRYNPDNLEEYEGENVRRRRKNNKTQVKTEVPKIRAILAILENRRIDDPESAEALMEIYEDLLKIENDKKVRVEKSLQIDAFFK